jgi:hypothetical protein
MILVSITFLCFGVPVLLIALGMTWLWLGQKVFGWIF